MKAFDLRSPELIEEFFKEGSVKTTEETKVITTTDGIAGFTIVPEGIEISCVDGEVIIDTPLPKKEKSKTKKIIDILSGK